MMSMKFFVATIFAYKVISALDLDFEKKIAEEFGSLNDPFFPYKFNTGAGNREELILKKVLVDESGDNTWLVKLNNAWQNRWISLRLPDGQILATSSSDQVIVLRADSTGPPVSGLSLHSSFTDLFEGVGQIELIEHWNHSSQTKQPFLLVSFSDYGMQTLFWYRILPDKLEYLNRLESPSSGKVVSLRWIREDFNEFLIIMSHEDSGKTKIDISKYMLNDSKNPHLFQTLCVDKTLLDGWSTTMDAVLNNDRVFIAVITGQLIQVYVYDLYERDFGLKLKQLIQAPGVTDVRFFSVANRIYLAVNGERADFLQIPHEGYLLEPMINFGSVDEWLLLPVLTYRRDIVALARKGDNVEAVLWHGSAGFSTVKHPPCYSVNSSLQIISELSEGLQCLSFGNWTSAAVLEVGDLPAVLMKRPSVDNSFALFHIEAVLVSTDSPGAKLRKMHAAAVHMHERVKCLGKEIEDTDWLEERSVETSPDLKGWPNLELLDSCLANLDQEIDNLERLVEEGKANNIMVSMHINHGKLSGNSIGKLFNESVEAHFSGNLVHGPMRSANEKYEVLLDVKVTINNSRKYRVKNKLLVGSLEVSGDGLTAGQIPVPIETGFPVFIAPEPSAPTPELISARSQYLLSRVDQPLHKAVEDSVHTKRSHSDDNI